VSPLPWRRAFLIRRGCWGKWGVSAVRILFPSLILGALLAVTLSASDARKSRNALPTPTVRPAIDGILAGFQDHPLVAIGNDEDYAQEEDFYAALVRDPRFARNVGNVVVEFGAGAHQDIIDHYLNGQDVSFSDLRKVWSDTVGFNIPYAIGYVNFFVQVRNVNRTLPPAQRIHVWLGEPPIDWSKARTKADFSRFLAQRDTHPAEIIETEILAKNKKALVIYGDGHFFAHNRFMPVIPLVEQKHSKAIFIVQMYAGFATKACTARFEKTIQNWPTPALATPVRGSSLDGKLYRPGCDVVPRTAFRFPPAWTEAQKSQAIDDAEQKFSGADADALLFLGKAAVLTQSSFEPSIYLDPDYLREMNRRATLGFNFNIGGAPMTDAIVKSNPVSPQFVRRY
jgi:hypothetical protein